MPRQPDEGHKLTDKELAALEKRIGKVYNEAKAEIDETVKSYFESFKSRDAKMKELIGTIINGKEWTENDYRMWRVNQIGRGKRFEALRDKIAERYTKANEVAVSYVNDAAPGIYSLNRNYAAYTIEAAGASADFTLWDEQTVKRLIVEEPDVMPYYPEKRAVKRGIDLKWGKQQITKSVTSGILQGKSVGKIATDLQSRIKDMNRTSAIRAARTAVTGAQNAGRMDSYVQAEKMGIEIQKEWLATLDSRTRHSHAMLDREKVDVDKKFSNKCRFPGDPQGPSWEVHNCRCTVIAAVKGVDTSDAQRRARDPITGQSELISNMNYQQWYEWKQRQRFGDLLDQKTSNGITIKRVTAHSIGRSDERSVSVSETLDAIRNPLHTNPIKTDEYGRRSQQFIGTNATAAVNPDTGNLTTVWRTGKRMRKKYGGQQ